MYVHEFFRLIRREKGCVHTLLCAFSPEALASCAWRVWRWHAFLPLQLLKSINISYHFYVIVGKRLNPNPKGLQCSNPNELHGRCKSGVQRPSKLDEILPPKVSPHKPGLWSGSRGTPISCASLDSNSWPLIGNLQSDYRLEGLILCDCVDMRWIKD